LKNLIHKSIETEETLKFEELGAGADEALGSLTGKTGIRDHSVFLAEKDWRDKLRQLT
jgi:hypothetical protein